MQRSQDTPSNNSARKNTVKEIWEWLLLGGRTIALFIDLFKDN